ncbi:MAG: nucleotidyltransferase family protein [Ruminococcus sp.]|nr:nucleotidyltransferase family protein [Ruminococcus sp.]
MDKKIRIESFKDVIYLTYCALHGRVPSRQRLLKMKLSGVYTVSLGHGLGEVCARVLLAAGVRDRRFTALYKREMQRRQVTSKNKKALTDRLEEEKIWYMPLYGDGLGALYPYKGTRHTCGAEILVDSKYRLRLLEIIEEMGFYTDRYGEGNFDIYTLPPLGRIDIYTGMLSVYPDDRAEDYYSCIKRRLISDKEGCQSYHLSQEDLYVYLLARDESFYKEGRFALSDVFDIFLYRRAFGSGLDREYIKRELRWLRLDGFERVLSKLADDLFCGSLPLSRECAKMLYGVAVSEVKGKR